MGRGPDPLVKSSLSGIAFTELAAQDIEAVAEIERQSFEHPWSPNLFLRELQSAISRIVVARETEASHAVLGYLCRWVVADEMQIQNLAVHPEHRRRGIGRALMTHVLEEGRSLALRCVTLEVRDGNAEAVALYEALGFARVGQRHDYYGRGHHGVLMTLALKPGSTAEQM